MIGADVGVGPDLHADENVEAEFDLDLDVDVAFW